MGLKANTLSGLEQGRDPFFLSFPLFYQITHQTLHKLINFLYPLANMLILPISLLRDHKNTGKVELPLPTTTHLGKR